MRKGLEHFERHVIVCGAGRTGSHVINELLATRTPCVVIDQDAERIARLREDHPVLGAVEGDATEDETLLAAGIDRAFGIVAALSEDKDNVYVTLTARSANPALRIVAKVMDAATEPKLRRAGADAVVGPNEIGGMRLAGDMLRPNVVEFLDLMMTHAEYVLRIEEATVAEESSVAGRTIGSINLRKACDVLVLAARLPNGTYRFNPGAELVLERGLTLIVLGEREEVAKLRAVVTAGTATVG
jgi:voltage-gated potassium channel